MNRAVAVTAASIDAVNAAQASVIQERNERRGIFFLVDAAAGFGGVGFGAAGTAVVTGDDSRESSLLIGILYEFTNLKLLKRFE